MTSPFAPKMDREPHYYVFLILLGLIVALIGGSILGALFCFLRMLWKGLCRRFKRTSPRGNSTNDNDIEMANIQAPQRQQPQPPMVIHHGSHPHANALHVELSLGDSIQSEDTPPLPRAGNVPVARTFEVVRNTADDFSIPPPAYKQGWARGSRH